MALGGGVFTSQNKVLNGSYINFVSASAASATISDRGIATMPLEFTMGGTGKVYTVTKEDFLKNSKSIFGYNYTDEKLKGLRDLFKNIHTLYAYNLKRSGGANATGMGNISSFATCLAEGSLGNKVSLVIASNGGKWDVITKFDGNIIDTCTVTSDGVGFVDNAFVKFDTSSFVYGGFVMGNVEDGEYPFEGGKDGTITGEAYQKYLDAIESYSFNTIGTTSTDDTVKALFAEWTKRMRNEIGIKFQCVLYKYAKADFEGVVSVENKLVGETTESGNAVYWVVGASAGCAINKSLTNATYTGEFDIDVAHTQIQLEDAIKAGKFMFHRVNDTVRVLEDINTFVSFTDEKNEDFASNQTIRIIDQCGNDVAKLFNDKYLGKIANNESGRISLWNDIVKHRQELERIGAIENFNPDDVTVAQGDKKKAVVVYDAVKPVNAMAQLYQTIIVE
jgi:hypothetical protein